MHASTIALLVLAASSVAPVFSIPLSAHARSDPPTSNSQISTSLSPDDERLFHSLLTSREYDDSSTYFNLGKTRDFTPDQLDARGSVDNLVASLLTSRDFNANHNHIFHRSLAPFVPSRDNELQARSKAGDVFKKISNGILNGVETAASIGLTFLRRDAPLDELAARDDVPDLITLLNTPQANTARDSDDASNIRFLNALLKSRDITPARDDSTDAMFVKALLQSRDLTPEQQLVALALASRSFDEFYDDLD